LVEAFSISEAKRQAIDVPGDRIITLPLDGSTSSVVPA
jgi:hypothetical protein